MNSTNGTAVGPSKRARACALALSAIILCWTWTPLVTGQNGPEQDQGYAALTIAGEVGQVDSIEYLTDLTEPAEGDWRLLGFLQLPASPYLWVGKSAPVTDKRFHRTVAVAPTDMVFIPAGTFRMGSPEDEVDRELFEGPQIDVIISQGFWMGAYQVTQADYLEVMGNNPSLNDGLPGQNGLSHPVERAGGRRSEAISTVSFQGTGNR